MKIEMKQETMIPELKSEEIKKAVNITLKEMEENINISIMLCGKETIHELNKNYRNMDKPTDVLSFVYGNDEVFDPEESFFGEIIICPEIAKEQASVYSENFNSEMKRLIIHGILHILGYDHEISKEEEKRMTQKQEMLLKKLEDVDIC